MGCKLVYKIQKKADGSIESEMNIISYKDESGAALKN
jgi:hypothetical protein